MKKFKVYKGRKKNPEWQKHANLYNEGAEGYNPYAEFISEYEFVEKRQIGSKIYSVNEAKEMLQKLKDSLSKHSDKQKIYVCVDLINLFEGCLEGAI